MNWNAPPETASAIVVFGLLIGLAWRSSGLTAKLLIQATLSALLLGVLVGASRCIAWLLRPDVADATGFALTMTVLVPWAGYLAGARRETIRKIVIPLLILDVLAGVNIIASLAVASPTTQEQLVSLPAVVILGVTLSYVRSAWATRYARVGTVVLTILVLAQLPAVLSLVLDDPRIIEQLNATAVFLAVLGMVAYVMASLNPHEQTLSGREMLMLALWFSLTLSLGENLVRFILNHTLGYLFLAVIAPVSFMPRSVFWMAPVADVSFYLAVTAGLLLVRRLVPAIAGYRFVIFLFTFFGILQILSPILTMFVNFVALLILELGLATAFMRVAARRSSGFQRVVKRTTAPLALIVLLLPIVVFARQELSRHRGLAALPEVEGHPPNVLLITLDTVRRQSMSLCGYQRPTTPFLETLASRGVVFDAAVAPASWTLPTHASLLTGRLPHEHGAGLVSMLDDTFPTLAETLRDRGYETAGFVANTMYCGERTGLNRGFLTYSDHKQQFDLVFQGSFLWRLVLNRMLHDQRKNADDVNREFLGWLDHRKSRPFFVFLNYFDAHDPYGIPDQRFDIYSSLPEDQRRALRESWLVPRHEVWSSNDPVEIQLALDTYEGAITYLDDRLHRLFDQLQARGLLKNTLVVITSDHGEHFGEHGQFGHSRTLYRQLIDTPLLISYPGHVPAGQRVKVPVGLVDVSATVIDLMKLKPRRPLPGTTLARFWDKQRFPGEPRPEPILSELEQAIGYSDALNGHGPIASLVAEGWHYIRYAGDGHEELFDFDRDPLDTHDLSKTPEGQRQLAHFRRLLEGLLPDKKTTGE